MMRPILLISIRKVPRLTRQWRTRDLEAILDAQEIKGYSVGTSGALKQMDYCWIIAYER
jgi:hypothetical protein